MVRRYPAAWQREQLYRSLDLMQRVEDYPVTICGAGALGANLAETLARSGFRKLRVIDRDRVEETNLSTQPWSRGDIGGFKARILQNALYRALGTEIEAQATELTEANARKLLQGSALVVDCFDNSASRRLLTQTGLETLHAGLSGDGCAEVIWNEQYRVPSDGQDHVCDYPLARTLVLLTVAVTAELILQFLETGVRENRTITLRDLCVRSL